MYFEICCDGFGSCLKCGMVLELLIVSGEIGFFVEFVDMMCWFWIGFVFMILVFFFEMGSYFIFGLYYLVF